MPIQAELHAGILQLRLRGGRGNCLGPELLSALGDALRAAQADGAPPILLYAGGSSFSTGLDLHYSLACDRPALMALMDLFHATLCELLFYPGPTLAAVGGHALAGGALLALACDERLVAEGAGKLGIHGARLGIGYPDIAVEIVRLRFARPTAERLLHGGELFAAESARRWGFASELCPAGELLPRGRTRLTRYRHRAAFAANKAHLLAGPRSRLLPMDQAGAARFADHWFSGDTQRRLRDAAAKLSGNSDPARGEPG